MTADLMILPQQLPLVDLGDSDSFSDDIFDPLPLDAQNDCDVFLLGDLRMMDELLRSPKMTMKRVRRVAFQDQPIEISVPSFACLGEAERGALWYKAGEIERFRSMARHVSRSMRRNPGAYPTDITRGLELRTSQHRQYAKHLTISCILKAQGRYPDIDPFHLAAIADRCSHVPRQQALDQATRDYEDAYLCVDVVKRGPEVCLDEPPAKRHCFVAPQEEFPILF